MIQQPPVSIVILNWNGWADTIECIRSVQSITYKNYKIVVVDNSSTDSSIEKIKSEYPSLEILLSPSNLGFGGGNNIGISHSIDKGAKYIWLLNNDTIVHENSLGRLVEVAEADDMIGAVGSSISDFKFPYNTQSWGGGRISFLFGRTWHLKRPGKIDYLTAASMLIRSSIIQSVGIFDSKYFMYWEDVDLSIRIKKFGYKLAVADLSRVYHKESVSLGKENPLMDAYYNYSATRFFTKHSKIGIVPILVGSFGRIIKRLSEGNVGRARIVFYNTILALLPDVRTKE